ncbi:hypothetical protein P4O66_021701, partial [Electrophorus voltai]
MNEYASQRELLSENLSINICVELTRYLQELKQERKSVRESGEKSQRAQRRLGRDMEKERERHGERGGEQEGYLADVKKAQQNLELNFKHLEACKKRFEKEWKEAEKVNQQVEKTEQDPGSTKADVDKVRMIAHQRTHTADECKNEYAAQLQKYNKMQNSFYHTETPAIFNDSMTLMEQHKSGVAPPTDVEFEDYSPGIKPATMENSVHRSPKVQIKQLFKKNKSWLASSDQTGLVGQTQCSDQTGLVGQTQCSDQTGLVGQTQCSDQAGLVGQTQCSDQTGLVGQTQCSDQTGLVGQTQCSDQTGLVGQTQCSDQAGLVGQTQCSDQAGLVGQTQCSDQAGLVGQTQCSDQTGLVGQTQCSDQAGLVGQTQCSDQAGLVGQTQCSDQAGLVGQTQCSDQAGLVGQTQCSDQARLVGQTQCSDQTGLVGQTQCSEGSVEKESLNTLFVVLVFSLTTSLWFTYQQAFQEVVNEMNEYASQRELLSENLSINICVELTRYLQELKQERKSVRESGEKSQRAQRRLGRDMEKERERHGERGGEQEGYLADVKKAQQNLELNFKHLEACKKRFEKEWKEAEKVNQQVEKTEQDPGSTKADVDKVRMIAHQRTHTADECKNEYAAQLQKYNKMQNSFYHTETPAIFNDSMTLMEQHKSGVAPPTDVEFEDYSQGIKPATMENSVHRSPKVRIKQLFKKNKPLPVEDYSHLPLDQKKKRLKEKIDDIAKELQKEMDQSEALSKMKGVYEKNSHLGDPASLEPQINQTTHNINRLKVELTRYKTWLNETGDVSMHNNQTSAASISVFPKGQNFSEPEPADNIYECDFDDFDEDVPIGQCQALYNFD